MKLQRTLKVSTEAQDGMGEQTFLHPLSFVCVDVQDMNDSEISR